MWNTKPDMLERSFIKTIIYKFLLCEREPHGETIKKILRQ